MTEDRLLQMQQEAAERVRRWEEACARRGRAPTAPVKEVYPVPRERPCPPAQKKPPQASVPTAPRTEGDRLLVMLLALLLLKNGAQTELILALLYIAL